MGRGTCFRLSVSTLTREWNCVTSLSEAWALPTGEKNLTTIPNLGQCLIDNQALPAEITIKGRIRYERAVIALKLMLCFQQTTSMKEGVQSAKVPWGLSGMKRLKDHSS